MSFGAVGSARPRSGDPCVCGSGERYSGCCGPLLAGAEAPSAERLMRSRYSAFVLGDTAHLARSWHPRTRPADLVVDPALRWLGLRIVAVDEQDDRATVSFRARWAREGEHGVLAERSRFARRAGRWVYVDGDAGDGSA